MVRLSYKVILGGIEFDEPNKDEVISLLIQQWNDRTDRDWETPPKRVICPLYLVEP